MLDYSPVGICMAVIVIVLCVIADRFRGDPKDIFSRSFERLGYGVLIALLTGTDDWRVFISIALAFYAGSTIGWGNPYGAYVDKRNMYSTTYHWWQIGILKKNVMAALIARGFLWAAPMIPVCMILNDGWSAPIGIFIAFPLALVIGRHINIRFSTEWISVSHEWDESEIIRPIIAGLITYLLPGLWSIFYG